ncbi:hypothetical protein C7M84_017688 [Penaeus vannamei]|uniref:Integrase catalytic domain-containing protein n=1 Tax=Penaeus vannamei TaxID=6689 RepID=A0A3R7SK31_PENVA|nr:hypothetical protein C7M84_017688 [Penaeus vannamei]
MNSPPPENNRAKKSFVAKALQTSLGFPHRDSDSPSPSPSTFESISPLSTLPASSDLTHITASVKMNSGMPTMYNVASKFSSSNVSVDQFFADVEDTVIHSGVSRESEHFAASCLVAARMRLNHEIPRVAEALDSFSRQTDNHHLRLVELLEVKPTSFSKDDLSSYLNKFRVKLMQWAQSIPSSDASGCLTQCVTQSASHAAVLEHFAKAWLLSAVSPAVRKRVCDKVDSASFAKLPEVLANEITDKSGNVQIVANVVNLGKDKGNDQSNNSAGRRDPRREPPARAKAGYRRAPPAPAVRHVEQPPPPSRASQESPSGPQYYVAPSPPIAARKPHIANWAPKSGQCRRCLRMHRPSVCSAKPLCPYCNRHGHAFNECTWFPDQANGVTERLNRSILTILRQLVDDSKDDWDALLPTVQSAINSTFHSSLGDGPHFLLTGQDKRLPYKLLEMKPRPLYADNYANYLVSRQQQTFQQAKALMTRSRDRIIEYQHKNRSRRESIGVGA